MMKNSIFVLVVLGLSLVASQTLQVTTYAYFDRCTGGSNQAQCRNQNEIQYGGPQQPQCGSAPPSQGRWGTATSGQNSGLGFLGVQNISVPLNTDFYLGALTHFNFPIKNAATAIYLNLLLTVRDSLGQVLTLNDPYPFQLLVNETPNQGNVQDCPFPSTIACSDKITFASSFIFDRSFQVNSVSYTLSIQGFKESDQSQSSPVTSFISNENAQRTGYLFARFTAACPSSCLNGGTIYIDSNNNCVCNCSSTTCPSPKIPTSNCDCTCPARTCYRSGTVNPNTCACNCPTACPNGQVVNPNDCSCYCPSGVCTAGSTMNPNTCACDCSSLSPCLLANQVRSSTCACTCNITCPANQVRDTASCTCKCRTGCSSANYVQDPSTCNCACNRICHNSVVNNATCLCGNCNGDWTKDSDGDCTVCSKSTGTCPSGSVFDASLCRCVCPNIAATCAAQNKVVDTTQACACRNCANRQECICGNGIVEPGEQCDFANNTNQCCVNCMWSDSSCNDGNPCTSGDVCSNVTGTIRCQGSYACTLSGDCFNQTCTASGCQNRTFTDGTTCRSGDLCVEKCIAGVCAAAPVSCPDPVVGDCFTTMCSPSNGSCIIVPLTGTSCNDGNECTTNDRCTAGVCNGTVKYCNRTSNACVNPTCNVLTGNCDELAVANGSPCDYDGSLCTVGDACANGLCYEGTRTICNSTSTCNSGICDPLTGSCTVIQVPNALNKTCDDNNICTKDDRCVDGACTGDQDESHNDLVICGAIPPTDPASVNNNTIIIFAVAGGAALIGAIAGLAFLLKRIRDKKLLDADTWNPDTFSSVAVSPLYKGSEKSVDNRLYEGSM